jgi:DNA-binding MarR family transcriptional regulator
MSTPTTRTTRRRRGVPDPNIGILVRDPYLAVSAALHERLAAVGFDDLRPAHLVIFQHVDPDGTRLTTLAERAQLTTPSIKYLVDALEDRGYVERVADPTDGRARLVRLTERGWQQISTALEILADVEDEWAELLGRRRFARLRGDLLELNRLIAGPTTAD